MAVARVQGKRWFKCHWFYRPEDTTNVLDAKVVAAEKKVRRRHRAGPHRTSHLATIMSVCSCWTACASAARF